MSQSAITELLGAPDFTEGSTIIYIIVKDYGTDIDPVYIKSLRINFNNYGRSDSVWVHEWKK